MPWLSEGDGRQEACTGRQGAFQSDKLLLGVRTKKGTGVHSEMDEFTSTAHGRTHVC